MTSQHMPHNSGHDVTAHATWTAVRTSQSWWCSSCNMYRGHALTAPLHSALLWRSTIVLGDWSTCSSGWLLVHVKVLKIAKWRMRVVDFRFRRKCAFGELIWKKISEYTTYVSFRSVPLTTTIKISIFEMNNFHLLLSEICRIRP